MQYSRILTSMLAIAACAVLSMNASQAQAADATGTYTWTMQGRQGGGGGGGGDQAQARKVTLKLKQDGSKLTGTIATPGRQGGQSRDVEISDGKITGDDVSFNVVREFNNNKMTQKYTGKLSADSIKGKIEFERNGETQSRDWEAKKEKK